MEHDDLHKSHEYAGRVGTKTVGRGHAKSQDVRDGEVGRRVSTQDWQKVEELLHQAMALAPEFLNFPVGAALHREIGEIDSGSVLGVGRF
jgi:hypothetical protein